MAEKENILISLEPRHAANIYAGRKSVELRRRTMHVAPGTVVWIYEKRPVGSITGCVSVAAVHPGSPPELWRLYGAVSGLSKREFFDYFSDASHACALLLKAPRRVKHPLSLESLKRAGTRFHPPQFFIRLISSHPLLVALNSCSTQNKRTPNLLPR